MNQKILYSIIITLVISLSLVLSIVINNFNNESDSITLNFTGNESFIRNISFSKDAVISSVYMTLKGTPYYNFTNVLNASSTFTGYINFTSNSINYSSGDIFVNACIFGCSYFTIQNYTDVYGEWSSVYSYLPNCSNVSYGRETISSWNKTQFLCVNDSQGILRVIQFNTNSTPITRFNISWENYSAINSSEITNSYIEILNNETITQKLCYQEFANVSTDCGGLSTGKYYYSNTSIGTNYTDGDYDTYTTLGIDSGYQYFIINYTKPLSSTYPSYWTVKNPDGILINHTINSSCWNAYTDKLVLKISAEESAMTEAVKYYCYDGSNFIYINFSFNRNIYEEAIIWNISNYSYIWTFPGVFNTTDVTRDFSTDINNFIDNGECNCYSCSLSGNNCTLNFNIHSDTSGYLQVYDMNISWTESINPSLEILNPVNITYNASSYPLEILVSDNWLMNDCIFWITKDSVVTRTNTTWDCTNTTLGETTSGYYYVHICAIDSFNNHNCTNQSYNINVPVQSGGGGGSSSSSSHTIITNLLANWSVQTNSGTLIYDLRMTAGSSRQRVLSFENYGTSKRNIKLSCENVNSTVSDICKYIYYDIEEFDLPVLKGIKTNIIFTVDLPIDIEDGIYIVNLVSIDESENVGVVTVSVQVGELGLFTNTLDKAGLSTEVNGFKIPYLIIGLFVGLISGMILYYFIRKTKYGSSASIIIAIIVTFLTIAIV